MDTAPETQIHTGKVKVKFNYAGAQWRGHQVSKWEDSKDTERMATDRKCLEQQASSLAWSSFYGEAPVPFCLKYVCPLASDDDQRGCPLATDV